MVGRFCCGWVRNAKRHNCFCLFGLDMQGKALFYHNLDRAYAEQPTMITLRRTEVNIVTVLSLDWLRELLHLQNLQGKSNVQHEEAANVHNEHF